MFGANGVGDRKLGKIDFECYGDGASYSSNAQ